MNRDFKGVWIPSSLYLDTSLTWTQKIILIEVDSFAKNNLECFVSNQHLSELIGISESGIEKAIKSLVDRGMLVRSLRKKAGGTHRTLKVTHSQMRLTPTIEGECHPQSSEDATHTQVRHTITNTTITKSTKTNRKGKPQSFDEVYDYFKELEMNLEEAEKFVDWYDSVGWKVKGGNLIKDWKAAARQWKRRNAKQLKDNNRYAKKGFNRDNFTPDAINDFITNG